MTSNKKNWRDEVDEVPIICSDPVDVLIEDLERRYRERTEEQPDKDPTVSMAWVLNRLVKSRNAAVKLDRWLDLRTIAALADCSYETARTKAHEMPEGMVRENGWNGKLEVHIEAVAEKLDMTTDDIRTKREKLDEAA